MCIIAMKPEGVVLSDAKLYHMWKNNPDGAGFMYAENGKLHIVKGLMDFQTFIKALNEAGPKRKLVLHFRIRTHGAVKEQMTHPFWITNNLGMVHNGVISKLASETTSLRSDTAVFAAKLANEYTDPLKAIQNKFHIAMIESFIGYSKLVFMDSTGQTYIINESLGHWEKGVWFSNTGYKPHKVTAKKNFWGPDEKEANSCRVLSDWTSEGGNPSGQNWKEIYADAEQQDFSRFNRAMASEAREHAHRTTSGKSGNDAVSMRGAPIIQQEMRNGKMVEVKVYPSAGSEHKRGRR